MADKNDIQRLLCFGLDLPMGSQAKWMKRSDVAVRRSFKDPRSGGRVMTTLSQSSGILSSGILSSGMRDLSRPLSRAMLSSLATA